jgi:RNA polymerase sigma factor (sigma-70 family)
MPDSETRSMNDQEVVRGFLDGEEAAVEAVDGWISRAAWPYQRRLSNCWDDVLQDVRLEVTRLLGQGKFRGESSLRTYLWRVVSHTCLDQLRSQSRWQWADLEALEQADELSAPVEDRGPEHRDLLQRVLGKVSEDCRSLWRMIVMGLSYREMSARLGVAEGTLRVRVLRCREKAVALRRELQGPGRNIGRGGSPNFSGEARTDEP